MDNQPTEYRCPHCGATGNPRTGKPFDATALRMHVVRSHGENHEGSHGENHGVTTRGDSPVDHESNRHGENSTKSTVASVAEAPNLSSSEEEEGADEKKKTRGVQWDEHKFCRTHDRDGRSVRVFSGQTHGIMKTFQRKGWRHASEDLRTAYLGIIAELESHIEECEAQVRTLAETEARRKKADDDQREQERLAHERKLTEWGTFEKAQAEREAKRIEDEANGITPEAEPDPTLTVPLNVCQRLFAMANRQLLEQLHAAQLPPKPLPTRDPKRMQAVIRDMTAKRLERLRAGLLKNEQAQVMKSEKPKRSRKKKGAA